MLKKLVVAVLACITLFLSQRTLIESRAHSLPEARTERDDARNKDTGTTVKAARTAILF